MKQESWIDPSATVGSGTRLGHGVVAVGGLDACEVGDLEVAVAIEEEVAGDGVAVWTAAGVGALEAGAAGQRELEGAVDVAAGLGFEVFAR